MAVIQDGSQQGYAVLRHSLLCAERRIHGRFSGPKDQNRPVCQPPEYAAFRDKQKRRRVDQDEVVLFPNRLD